VNTGDGGKEWVVSDLRSVHFATVVDAADVIDASLTVASSGQALGYANVHGETVAVEEIRADDAGEWAHSQAALDAITTNLVAHAGATPRPGSPGPPQDGLPEQDRRDKKRGSAWLIQLAVSSPLRL
jgi:hypothetical protein